MSEISSKAASKRFFSLLNDADKAPVIIVASFSGAFAPAKEGVRR